VEGLISSVAAHTHREITNKLLESYQALNDLHEIRQKSMYIKYLISNYSELQAFSPWHHEREEALPPAFTGISRK
jgi:hypothetical protein